MPRIRKINRKVIDTVGVEVVEPAVPTVEAVLSMYRRLDSVQRWNARKQMSALLVTRTVPKEEPKPQSMDELRMEILRKPGPLSSADRLHLDLWEKQQQQVARRARAAQKAEKKRAAAQRAEARRLHNARNLAK